MNTSLPSPLPPTLAHSARPAAALSLAALALTVAGCANPAAGTPARLLLAERTHLELRMPAGWSHTPSWDLGPKLGLVRFTSRGPESTQLLLTPRLNASPANAAQQLERARQELAASGECAALGANAAAATQRATPAGMALFCTRSAAMAQAPGLVPVLAGVLVGERLTVRFKQFDAAEEVTTATWAILGSLRAASAEQLP